jgi:4a-hydroxytetrahydrobiopterin dehydratase
MTEWITPRQFHEADGVKDWRVLGEGACTYFRTGSFAAGARLSERDVELARQISAMARELGVPADPSAVQTRPSHDRRARRL